MHAFEELLAALLERAEYWVRSSVKVELTKEEKRAIGRPSSPRWELDLLGYHAGRNELLILECKSYLDSDGVRLEDLSAVDGSTGGRYKLFTEPELLRVVSNRLVAQLLERGGCLPNPTVKLGLATGKIASTTDRTALTRHFERNRWVLWTPEFIVGEIRRLADDGYDNSAAAMVAKLLLRSSAASAGALTV